MKSCLLLLFVFTATFLQAQIVNIPDANFKNALVNTNCVDTNGDSLPDSDADTNNDGEIQVVEAEAVVTLWTLNQGIISLEGLQNFTNLQNFVCDQNQIATIDISQNQVLGFLSCSSNNLTSLDVSQNFDLTVLRCGGNLITGLDVTQNSSLRELTCGSNDIAALDVSQNLDLQYLECQNNTLTSLDVSENSLLQLLWCHNNLLSSLNINNSNNEVLDLLRAFDNPNLFCIQVDDEDFANSQECASGSEVWCIDPWTEYSEDCGLGAADLEGVSIRLYPNPVQSFLYIQSEIQWDVVNIYSSTGQLILQNNQTSIDVSGLSAGIYFAALSKEGQTITRKFIKT